MSIIDDKVVVNDPVAYEREVAAKKHFFLSNQNTELDQQEGRPNISANSKKKLKSRKAANNRVIKLWLPTSKRIILHSLKVPDGEDRYKIVSDPLGITEGFKTAWEPIFKAKEINVIEAKKYAEEHAGNWDWSVARRPTLATGRHLECD